MFLWNEIMKRIQHIHTVFNKQNLIKPLCAFQNVQKSQAKLSQYMKKMYSHRSHVVRPFIFMNNNNKKLPRRINRTTLCMDTCIECDKRPRSNDHTSQHAMSHAHSTCWQTKSRIQIVTRWQTREKKEMSWSQNAKFTSLLFVILKQTKYYYFMRAVLAFAGCRA